MTKTNGQEKLTVEQAQAKLLETIRTEVEVSKKINARVAELNNKRAEAMQALTMAVAQEEQNKQQPGPRPVNPPVPQSTTETVTPL